MLFNKVAQPANLFDLIFVGNGDQDRLVKSSAYDPTRAPRRERGDALEVFGMFVGQPLEQRAGVVQPQANARMPRDTLQKRQVRAFVRAFHHIVKISDGLVRVDEKDQVEFLQERTSNRADVYHSASCSTTRNSNARQQRSTVMDAVAPHQ